MSRLLTVQDRLNARSRGSATLPTSHRSAFAVLGSPLTSHLSPQIHSCPCCSRLFRYWRSRLLSSGVNWLSASLWRLATSALSRAIFRRITAQVTHGCLRISSRRLPRCVEVIDQPCVAVEILIGSLRCGLAIELRSGVRCCALSRRRSGFILRRCFRYRRGRHSRVIRRPHCLLAASERRTGEEEVI